MDSLKPVLHFLREIADICTEAAIYSISTIYDAIDTFRFNFTYPEPDLLGQAEEGANQSRAMKLFYRVGMRRFLFFYRSRNDLVKYHRIVGARIFRPEVSIQIKDILKETAGPWDDFHGNIPTASDILHHCVTDDNLCGFSRSSWKENGKLEIVTTSGTWDNGTPKLDFRTLGMDEPIIP